MNTRKRRWIARGFLMIMLQNIFLPVASWGLTSGPYQQEYLINTHLSGEQVNPLTGDFSYPIPLINVPGPEGGFSLPLVYRSGIPLEEESSWVGLGWSLNAGAITRTVSQFPDDYDGQSLTLSTGSLSTSLPPLNYRQQSPSRKYNVNSRSGRAFPYYRTESITDKMYGSLYLGKMPSSGSIGTVDLREESVSGTARSYTVYNIGSGERVASDMHMETGINNAYVLEPTSIAYDSYNVSGPGMSGALKPYRHETGSLAFPHKGSLQYARYKMVDFLDYKVNFRYEGDIANSYLHHTGTEGALFNTSTPNFGVGFNPGPSISQPIVWILNDDNLYSTRKETRSPGNGLNNDQLTGANFVKWFSNGEINNATATNSGLFLDFLPASSRTAFRGSLPQNSIGGFSITRADGNTYHYALPVYNLNQLTIAPNASVSNNNRYATTWLLTGITGADFIDRGETGIIDDQDWGYWVKLDYGKFSNNYLWSVKYHPAQNPSENMSGAKETYYLNTIKTRSHTALFIKDVRADGRGCYSRIPEAPPVPELITYPSSSLKLSEIVVLKNEDADKLLLPVGSGGMGLTFASGNNESALKNGDTFNQVLDVYDMNQTMKDFIKPRQVQKAVLNYYAPGDPNELCKGTLNSFTMNASVKPPFTNAMNYSGCLGKLTLKSISVLGANDSETSPDHIFEYGSNSDYHIEKWDAWGMYKSNGSTNAYGRIPSGDWIQWSLSKIVTPLGGEILIEYERDTYASVSGNDAKLSFQNSLQFNQTNNTITIDNYDMANIRVGDKVNITGVIRTPDPGCIADFNDVTVNDVTVTAINGSTISLGSTLLRCSIYLKMPHAITGGWWGSVQL